MTIALVADRAAAALLMLAAGILLTWPARARRTRAAWLGRGVRGARYGLALTPPPGHFPKSHLAHYYLGAKSPVPYMETYRLLHAGEGRPQIGMRDLERPVDLVRSGTSEQRAYYIDLLRAARVPFDPLAPLDTLAARAHDSGEIEAEARRILATRLPARRVAACRRDVHAALGMGQGAHLSLDYGYNGSPLFGLIPQAGPPLPLPVGRLSGPPGGPRAALAGGPPAASAVRPALGPRGARVAALRSGTHRAPRGGCARAFAGRAAGGRRPDPGERRGREVRHARARLHRVVGSAPARDVGASPWTPRAGRGVHRLRRPAQALSLPARRHGRGAPGALVRPGRAGAGRGRDPAACAHAPRLLRGLHARARSPRARQRSDLDRFPAQDRARVPIRYQHDQQRERGGRARHARRSGPLAARPGARAGGARAAARPVLEAARGGGDGGAVATRPGTRRSHRLAREELAQLLHDRAARAAPPGRAPAPPGGGDGRGRNGCRVSAARFRRSDAGPESPAASRQAGPVSRGARLARVARAPRGAVGEASPSRGAGGRGSAGAGHRRRGLARGRDPAARGRGRDGARALRCRHGARRVPAPGVALAT